eukprot:m.271359 g.271359  ORF g.271359 m.271359 type:complete len:64 (-) comp54775_c0_seq10:65-256(-)
MMISDGRNAVPLASSCFLSVRILCPVRYFSRQRAVFGWLMAVVSALALAFMPFKFLVVGISAW